MVDRPHIVIPGDVTSSFATSQELTGDTLHLAALTRTAHSRLIILEGSGFFGPFVLRGLF